MKRDIQLLIFNSFIGNPAGFKLITSRLGFLKGLSTVIKMQLNMVFNNPFHSLNQKNVPLSWKERLSQKQILPAFALYDVLIKQGYDKTFSISVVEDVVVGVAKKFLQFTVPVISQSDVEHSSQEERQQFFARIVDRFPNSFGQLDIHEGNAFHFSVNACLFARYSKQLGYQDLAQIFCKADRAYFDQYQPLLDFSRNETLAGGGNVCDFKFNLIAKV